MEVSELSPGAKILLEDGSVGEVVGIASHGKSASLKLLEAPFDPGALGSIRECTSFDLVAFVGGEAYDSSKPPLGR